MDIIDRYIKGKEYNKIGLMKHKHTWENFYAAAKKDVFCLFGVGEGANLYFFKHGNFANIEMVVDNNKKLQGLPFRLFTADYSGKEEMLIEDPSVLSRYKDSNLVVLITSLRYCDEIARELDSYGIKRYFSVLCMEILDRLSGQSLSLSDYREAWLEKVMQFPINKNKICIKTNCDGVGHAKEIICQLLSLRSDLEVVWLVNDLRSDVSTGVKKRLASNLYACEFEYRTSAFWIGDAGGGGLPTNISKRSGQVCIELKHWSSVTLKKFALDEGSEWKDDKVIESIKKTSALVDYVFVGSEFDERTCRSGLGVNGTYVYVGSPRSDILFKKDRKEVLLERFLSLRSKKILLYAPTFRRMGENMSRVGYVHELDFGGIKKALDERFGREWVILLRLHPMVAKSSSEIALPEYVIDVSDYPDAEELVAVADAMVTDYSSIMFESAYIKKPVFLLATDLEEYTAREREFYIDYETLPFSIARNNEELRNKVLAFDEEVYKENIDRFFDKYGVHEDGHAAERAAKFISDLIDEKVKTGEAESVGDYAIP